MQRSNLLLITNFPDEKSAGIIPGKLFEYLQSGNTIISIGPERSDVKTILDKTKAGKHFSAEEHSLLKEFILNTYEEWESGILINNESNISEFKRKNLTKKLVEILN